MSIVKLGRMKSGMASGKVSGVRRQMTDDREQKTPLRPEGFGGQADGSRQKTDDREQKTEDGDSSRRHTVA